MTLELLSPAGGADALNAAVRAGADAVYLGMDTFNARRNADNFTVEKLTEACRYAHLRGVQVFVTLNTLILPHEMSDVLNCAEDAYLAGADALIIQDIGLARQVADAFSGCPVHLSTQANIHDRWGVEAAALLGASRITLARELSIEEIAHLSSLSAERGMETEVFVHGALCVCYSGQCLMSSLIGQRSANRGLCAQACRLPYVLKTEGQKTEEDGAFLLSPKDLCAVDLIPALVEAGVSSFKIEGRMKSPEYVFSVTQVYREMIDALLEGKPAKATDEDYARLESAFTRGFTTAYLEGDRSNAMMSYKRPNNRGAYIGRVKAIQHNVVEVQCETNVVPGDVLEFWTRKGRTAQEVPADMATHDSIVCIPLDSKASSVRVADRVFRVRSAEATFDPDSFEPRIPVDGAARVLLDEPLEIAFRIPSLHGADGDAVEDRLIQRLHSAFPKHSLKAAAEGALVERARSKALTVADVEEHIGRMGQTPFRLASLQTELTEGVGLGFSQLHQVRAEALEALCNALTEPYAKRRHVSWGTPSSHSARRNVEEPTISALATNPDCARAAKRAGATRIYIPALCYRRGQALFGGVLTHEATQASYPHGCILQMPAITHDPIGSSREAQLVDDSWEYVHPEKPVLVESIAGLVRAASAGALPEVGSQLPLTNASAISTATTLGARRIWLSPELNLQQISQLAHQTDASLGMTIFGAVQLMVIEHCPFMSEGSCNQQCSTCVRRMSQHQLEDRKGYQFPVIADALGRGHLYNSLPLDAVPALPDLLDAGVTSFMVDTTLMNPEQAAQAVGRAVHALENVQCGRPPEKKLPRTTSGHLFRGVV